MTRTISPARAEKIKRVAYARQQGIIVLEDVHDAHNAAAVLRTADAFGFQKVYFIFEKEERYNPKKVGKVSSSSANKWLDFKVFTSTEECLTELKKEGYITYATVLADDAKSLYQTDFKEQKVALLFGNEHRGLSEKAMELVDHKIILPMAGMVQSLNISVTAAILMFEVARQREVKGKENFLLSPAEREILEQDFLER